MNVFKFRVIVDTEEDIFRDIEIDTSSTFEAFHQAILRAFEWEEGELASFYMSNETWDRGEEIPLMDMGSPEADEPSPDAVNVGNSMSSLKLNDRVMRPDEKMVYVYDFFRMWCFYIELQSVFKAKPGVLYPRISMAFGDAPDFTSKEVDLPGGFDMPVTEGSGKPELTGDPEIDQYLMDDGGDEDGESFDSLDDLDEFI